MLKYTEIFLGAQCNNKCLSCPSISKDEGTPDYNSIIASLNQKKNNSVVFFGGEPTLRNDLFELIINAKRSNYRRIKLITNGRAFSDMQFLFQIFNAGCYLFEIKIYGSSPAIHDYITQIPGSFLETIQGLENMQRLSFDKFVSIRIPVCSGNYADIENTVATVINLGINRIILSFQDHTLRIRSFLNHIRNSINTSILNRIWILTEGLPFCIMQGIEQHMSEIYSGLNSLCARNLRQHKFCKDCIYKELCQGVEKRYLDQFGHKEFLPIKACEKFYDIRALYD